LPKNALIAELLEARVATMNNELFLAVGFYVLAANGVSAAVAFASDPSRRARHPEAKPYKWGVYVGSMGVASIVLALLCFRAIEQPSPPTPVAAFPAPSPVTYSMGNDGKLTPDFIPFTPEEQKQYSEMVERAAREKSRAWLSLAILLFSVRAVSGWFMIKRKRLAWIVGTALSFNVFLWVINTIYAPRRRHGFETEARNSPLSKSVVTRLWLGAGGAAL
jgi:hypothetical protein